MVIIGGNPFGKKGYPPNPFPKTFFLLGVPKAKAFGTGVWGTTVLQKGFPQQSAHKAKPRQVHDKGTITL